MVSRLLLQEHLEANLAQLVGNERGGRQTMTEIMRVLRRCDL